MMKTDPSLLLMSYDGKMVIHLVRVYGSEARVDTSVDIFTTSINNVQYIFYLTHGWNLAGYCKMFPKLLISVD